MGTERASSTLKYRVLLPRKDPEVTGVITDDGQDKIPGRNWQAFFF